MRKTILLAILAALLAACSGRDLSPPVEVISLDETRPTFVFFFSEP